MADENNNKKTQEHSYGWHTAREYEPYIDAVIGEYAAELDKMVFDDAKQTDYLDALKYCANLVWSEYLVKQKEKHPEPNNALVNTDVLHTILLSLHPHNMLHSSIQSAEASDITIAENTHEALHQLDSFRSLILLQGAAKEEVEAWLSHLPTTYPAWAALMGWFLTLTSKMTAERIPGVGLVPGGQINKPRHEVCCHLSAMSDIAEALAKTYHWNFLAQYSILKEMLADFRVMHANYSGKSEGKEAEQTAGSNSAGSNSAGSNSAGSNSAGSNSAGSNPGHSPGHNPGSNPGTNTGHSHNPGHNPGSSPAGGPGSSKSGSNPGGSKTAMDSDSD